MVHGRHAEKAFAFGKLEIEDLEHDRSQLHHENPADNEEEKFLLDDEGEHAEDAAQREGA